MESRIPDELLVRFGDFVAERTGLDFPPARWTDLRRGIAETARTMGFDDPAECARFLLSESLTKAQLEALVSQLTVGETYLFRDSAAFDALQRHVLPELIRRQAGSEQRLRIWSAACCTGEEAYSIAIALRRVLPKVEEWNLHILATDINPQFLRRAEAGLFGKWSFRDTPPWLKEQYFRATPGGQFEILPQIREMVRFSELNLVDDVYPSLINDTNAMDIIFCRNVLMYFTPRQASKVLANLYRAQPEGGWLFLSPSDFPRVSDTPYTTANILGATVYRKGEIPSPATVHVSRSIALDVHPQPVFDDPCPETTPDVPADYSKIAEELPPAEAPPDAHALGLTARSLANLGRLSEALSCCDQWIQSDRLNPTAHYLRALVLEERGVLQEASQSLRTALYLDPKFPLAHFAMGNLSRRLSKPDDANRHLRNAVQLLRTRPANEILPESDGLTAGRLAEIISTLINSEALR